MFVILDILQTDLAVFQSPSLPYLPNTINLWSERIARWNHLFAQKWTKTSYTHASEKMPMPHCPNWYLRSKSTQRRKSRISPCPVSLCIDRLPEFSDIFYSKERIRRDTTRSRSTYDQHGPRTRYRRSLTCFSNCSTSEPKHQDRSINRVSPAIAFAAGLSRLKLSSLCSIGKRSKSSNHPEYGALINSP